MTLRVPYTMYIYVVESNYIYSGKTLENEHNKTPLATVVVVVVVAAAVAAAAAPHTVMLTTQLVYIQHIVLNSLEFVDVLQTKLKYLTTYKLTSFDKYLRNLVL